MTPVRDLTRDGKIISENHTVKVLVDRNGLLLSVTTKKYSYLLFISRLLIGYRRIITQDRIVAKAGYDIRTTLEIIDSQYGHGRA